MTNRQRLSTNGACGFAFDMGMREAERFAVEVDRVLERGEYLKDASDKALHAEYARRTGFMPMNGPPVSGSSGTEVSMWLTDWSDGAVRQRPVNMGPAPGTFTETIERIQDEVMRPILRRTQAALDRTLDTHAFRGLGAMVVGTALVANQWSVCTSCGRPASHPTHQGAP